MKRLIFLFEGACELLESKDEMRNFWYTDYLKDYESKLWNSSWGRNYYASADPVQSTSEGSNFQVTSMNVEQVTRTDGTSYFRVTR